MRSIEIEYILKNEEGKEVARFSDIEDAKQYDRMLTAAEEIFALLGNIKELDSVKEAIKDDIAFHIARHSDEVIDILSSVRGRKSKGPKVSRADKNNKTPDKEFSEQAVA